MAFCTRKRRHVFGWAAIFKRLAASLHPPVIKLFGDIPPSIKLHRSGKASLRITTFSGMTCHRRSAPSKAAISGESKMTSTRPVICSMSPVS
ncbi:hypothetical protein D3C87_1343360 [compost metagenome]